jgi:hypothetical protein
VAQKVYRECVQPLSKFVRSIVGLDAGAVREAFSTFINTPSLNAQQIRFLDLLVQYLSSNCYLANVGASTRTLLAMPLELAQGLTLILDKGREIAGTVPSLLEALHVSYCLLDPALLTT